MKTTVLKYKLLIIFIVCGFLASFGQTTLYLEQFNTAGLGQDGPTTNTTGVTSWSINTANFVSPTATTEYFKTVGGVFESCNTDAPGGSPAPGPPTVSNFSSYCVVWSSTLIAISGYSNVTVSADLSVGAGASDGGCIAYYSIDGGAFVEFSRLINTTKTGAGSASGLCGSNVVIKIAHWGTTSSRQYRHDNVQVTGAALPEPSAYPASFSAIAAASCTELDLSFSAFSTLTNANGYLIIQKQGSLPTGMPIDNNGYSVGSIIGDGTVSNIITNSSTTSANISGLSGNTGYYYKIFPYYYNGSNCTYNYYTAGTISNCNATTNVCIGLSAEPASNPAVFTATVFASCGKLALNFTSASTITDANGYLILRKAGSTSAALPIDGNAYAVGGTILDATVIANINNTATTTFTDVSLSNATQYYYYIFPYNYDGSNSASYNYKTVSGLTANQVTIWCEDLVGSPIGNQGGGYHTPGVGPHGNYSNWWAVNLYDKADMHNGSSSSVHNILSSICYDLNRSDPNWSSSAVPSTLDNINIYMANYSNVSTFTSAYTSESALNTGTGVTWTLVYNGSITFAGLGWQQINLQTPFYYNGTGSLLVKFTRVSGNTPSNYPTFGFLDASSASEIRNLNQTQINPSYKYMKMAFNSTCTGSVSTTGVILPIELTRFEGDCNNGKVILNWQTATEKNNKVFNIQRSNDGVYFETIGSVAGAGNSEQLRNYTFIDEDDMDGLAYYRLSQTDYDRKMSQSKIIAIDHKCGENTDTEILVYPNPTLNNTILTLKLLTRSSIYVEVYNGIGQLIKLTPSQLYEVGLQKINIETTELPTGVYFIKTIVDDKEYIKKIVKL